jgi:hypothetical protein
VTAKPDRGIRIRIEVNSWIQIGIETNADLHQLKIFLLIMKSEEYLGDLSKYGSASTWKLDPDPQYFGCATTIVVNVIFPPPVAWKLRIRIRDEQPGSYFRELRIFGVKILKFFDADPGWKKIRIRDPV